MKTKLCKICNAELEVEVKCKVCNEPTRLFCHACGIVREKENHPRCMLIDLNALMIESRIHI